MWDLVCMTTAPPVISIISPFSPLKLQPGPISPFSFDLCVSCNNLLDQQSMPVRAKGRLYPIQVTSFSQDHMERQLVTLVCANTSKVPVSQRKAAVPGEKMQPSHQGPLVLSQICNLLTVSRQCEPPHHRVALSQWYFKTNSLVSHKQNELTHILLLSTTKVLQHALTHCSSYFWCFLISCPRVSQQKLNYPRAKSLPQHNYIHPLYHSLYFIPSYLQFTSLEGSEKSPRAATGRLLKMTWGVKEMVVSLELAILR